MKQHITAIITFIFFTLNVNATVWYVNLNATGLNTGTTWTDAFTDLQDALTIASFGDQIWVAQGIYKPTSTTSSSFNFKIKNGVEVYGGFNGSETSIQNRDVAANTTTLSGNLGGSNNSSTVVSFTNASNLTILDGFTITGGNSSGYGAGIRSLDSSPNIRNCKISGNHADVGGGMSHSGTGSFTIENCVFSGNTSAIQGGAINIFKGTNNTISNSYFYSNQSAIGAAISVISTSFTKLSISNSVIAGNTGNSNIVYANQSGEFKLYNCLLVGNFVNNGSVIGTETFSSNNNNEIVNCTVAHNGQGQTTGSTDNAIALNNQSSIVNSIVYGNQALKQVLSTGLSVNDCIIEPTGNFGSTWTNIDTLNPLFNLPGNAINAPFDTTGLNYQLNLFSSGIDAGDNSNAIGTLDLAGNPRIDNSTVDLGAYESTFCLSTETFSQSGPYVLCGGSSITLNIPNSVNYLWDDGSTSSSKTITSAGTYHVLFEDNNGCRGEAVAVVTQAALPSPTIVFTNAKLQTGNFASYQWKYEGGVIAGATSNEHPPIEGHGTYSVIVSNAAGCVDSVSFCFSPVQLSASGPTTFCEGESVTLTISNGDNIIWSTGSLNSAITVTTGGTYWATVLNNAANCTVDLEAVVQVNPLPTPTVSISNSQLTTQTFATYQWYLDGSVIPGATSQTYTPQSNGSFSVEVTNSNGCTNTSVGYILDNLNLSKEEIDQLKIYPNPVNGNGILKLSWGNISKENNGNVQIKIVDAKGAIIQQSEYLNLPSSIQLEGLNTGFYTLVIQANEGFIRKKITVL